MPSFARSLLLALPAVLGLGASTAHAASADQFSVRYWVTDESGERTRVLQQGDQYFVDRARCECGQSLTVELNAELAADPAEEIVAFVGVACDVAEEVPDGQFRPCVKLHEGPAGDLQSLAGPMVPVHPVYFSNGVADPAHRSIDDPATAPAGRCDLGMGESGVWLCSPAANGTPGCQAEDFFFRPDDVSRVVKFDFMAPLAEVSDVTATVSEGAVELSWELPFAGDIQGFRVLCEDAETGEPVPGKEWPEEKVTAIHAGTGFVTAGNLCGDEPFSSVSLPASGDGSCGDGVVDAGEECDDGADHNGPDGACDADCTLRVSAGLHALDWAYVCTGHLAYNTDSVRIEGLPNDRAYNFVLVGYDQFGNVRSFAPVLGGAPEEAAGGCGCRTGTEGQGAWVMSLLLVGALARPRRRARA